MSEMFSSEMEVEEGSPMGGGECSESPVHMMVEPHVELDEDPDHNTLEPKVELEESLVEPHVEFQEGTTDHNENNVYPFDPLAPEYFAETDGTVDSTSSNYQAEAGTHEYSDTTLNGISQDSEDANAAINDNSLCNSVDTSLDATMDTSNSGLMESSLQEDDNTDYNEMQRTYLKDFYSSSAFPTSTDESSDNSFVERIPLSRFPSIVKVVERAEYETIQILYQLLYQRSAWDTQEILSKRILEFSGFAFNKNSEDYYNREMLLQTLPNSVLVKIGAILCLEQVKNVLSNVGLGRHDLINAIMDFLSLPRKKTRASRFNSANNNNKAASQNVEPCGCRNSCLSKFTEAERELLATHHKTIKPKKKAEAYFLSLITINRASKRPDDDAKKHRDYKYSYKIKIGRKEVNVCKGGFMMLHNVKMSMLNSLQLVMKTEKYDKNLLSKVVYPFIEGQEEPEPTPVPTSEADSKDSSTVSESSKVDTDNNQTDDEELKKKLSVKVPAVMVEKIDASKISPKKKKQANNEKDDSKDDAPGTKKDDNVRKKLRDFPLVVKSLDEASETLLIDLHFLLFSSSADSDKLKDNILDFDGFKFSADSEEYDERNEFFQRMSGKLITDVSRALSLGVMSKREETIQNILSFLMKPDESYLRAAGVSVPVILSDVELDDMEGFSDSDESITCEVVEKKVECIDLLSSGEDSDREDGKKKQSIKKEKGVATPKAAPVAAPTAVSSPKTTESVPVSKTTTPTPTTSSAETTTSQSSSSGVVRRLRDFETIRKIVNTHPPEYLVDIYELLFLKKNEADTLRNEILDFTGFTFEKGAPEYVKRKQVLDRMLYNNVRRVYNTLIHNSTEVKVFSKPTMINEIFQFLFKLPDHDTSVRPLPPGAKTLMPKTPTTAAITTKAKISPAPSAPPTSAPASILPSQSGKLSDLKRVFQRVACFPCEYLVDVHKLLFMTDCDPKVIRQNIFGFKGFSFSVDSTEFQQRKMYLEYLTFHSLRKISSVLTTRSVDLRNSTKHELASHLTDVLAEYCNTCIDTESITPTSAKENATTTAATTATTTTTVTSTTSEEIVVTPSIQSVQSVAPTATAASKTTKAAKSKNNPLNISIVETHSIKSPTKTTSSPARGSRKRKSQTVRQMVSEKKTPPPPASDFADIHLPEVEQYRQIYGANLNVFAEEYAEFLQSPTKPAKNRSPPKKNNKQKCLPTYNNNCSAECVALNSYDIEKIKRTKWIVALERIDINVCGIKTDSLKSDKLVPDLKANNHNTEDNLAYPVHSTTTYQEECQFTPQSAQSQSLYDSIFSLIDPCCKENISTKNSMKDACSEDPNVPTITGITSFGTPIAQPFPQLVPQTMAFPLVSPYPQTLQVQGQPQVIGLQSSAITMNSPIITQVTSKVPEMIIPADIEQTNTESQKIKTESTAEKTPSKDSPSKDSEEDGDQPLAALIGHPTDTVLQKHIADIVDKTDLQDITMNGVIQRVYDMYPKFDLSYRKEFIKSTLRSILYKLGDSEKTKESTRDSTSPDCSVTTSDIQDTSAPESPKASA